jgi:hypothetical protein
MLGHGRGRTRELRDERVTAALHLAELSRMAADLGGGSAVGSASLGAGPHEVC